MPALSLLLNAFIWGLCWLPFRRLEALGWHPLWVTALVYLVIVAAMAVLRPRQMRAFLAQPGLLALGVAAGLTNVGFNWGVTQGDVVRVVLLFYLMPLWSVLLARIILGERPTASALVRMALALAGVAVVLKTPDVDWPLPSSLPDWLGLAAGFCFALTNVLLRRMRHTSGELRALAMFGGCAGVAMLASVAGTTAGVFAVPVFEPLGWLGWVVALGGCLAFANVCLQYGVARLSASAASVIMLSEVIFASVSSVLLGAGVLGLRIWIGGALILLAALWAALTPPRNGEPAAGVAEANP